MLIIVADTDYLDCSISHFSANMLFNIRREGILEKQLHCANILGIDSVTNWLCLDQRLQEFLELC